MELKEVTKDYDSFIINLNNIKTGNFLSTKKGLVYFDLMMTTYNLLKVHLKYNKLKEKIVISNSFFDENFMIEFFGTNDLKEAEVKFQVIEKMINEIIKDNKIVIDEDDIIEF